MDTMLPARGPERNHPKQWASGEKLFQSVSSIYYSIRYHGDTNSAVGPILEMHIPDQIRILN